MSVIRFPAPEVIESHAELMRQASMEPEKTLAKALETVREEMEQYRVLRERMDERLQSLNARFQSSMERLTQLDLQLSDVESKEEQVKKLIDNCENYIRRLKNQPAKDSSSLSWLRSVDQGTVKQSRVESGQAVASESALSTKNEASIDREKEVRETVRKITDASIMKEKLESKKRDIRTEIDKETSIKDFFMIRIKRLQEPLKIADQMTSVIENDLKSAEEAEGTAKQLAERLLWLGMKLSQISDAVADLRRDVP